MLPKLDWGERPACHGPLLVLCHWLCGSAQTWSLVAERLAERGLRCVAVDLPGFGAAAEVPGYDVRAMADAVIATVQAFRADEPEGQPWLLAGHSMGGKVAAVVAREAANGRAGLEGLRGLVLCSPSPPGPEPMTDSKREEMLQTIGGSSGDAGKDRKQAEMFVANNVGEPSLGDATLLFAVDGVLQAKGDAVRAWLQSGSREDWGAFVGELPLPALVFAGTEDEALGPAAQREHTLPFFKSRGGVQTRLKVLDGARHLGPLERPGEVAEQVIEFCAQLGLPVRRRVTVGERFGALMHSERTSPQTRAVMEDRLVEDEAAYEPQALGRKGLRVLCELARRVVPGAPFDLAARMDRSLAEDLGDGWRSSALPGNVAAWRCGLASLDAAAHHTYGVSFAVLTDEWQDALMERASHGELGPGLGERMLRAIGIGDDGEEDIYSGAEMKLWMEDVRGHLAKLYMADPRTMERVGFNGFADEQGFTQSRLGEAEAWEH